jgi:hypothetical protein
MKSFRMGTIVLAALLPVAILGGCKGCKGDDDDAKPAASVSAPPAASPAPVTTVVPEEPDAGTDAPPDAPHPVGPGGAWGGGTLAKCCAALQQNANSAPLDQKAYYLAAANACNGMRNAPAGQQAFSNIRAFLAGAKMPAACK